MLILTYITYLFVLISHTALYFLDVLICTCYLLNPVVCAVVGSQGLDLAFVSFPGDRSLQTGMQIKLGSC